MDERWGALRESKHDCPPRIRCGRDLDRTLWSEDVVTKQGSVAIASVIRRYGVRPGVVVGVIAAIGFVLRAGPLAIHGTFGAGPDYDDGVNFVAAALLSEGVLPYRDFFYAHPPGALLVLSPIAALSGAVGPDTAFSLAGFMFAAVGTANVVLIGRFCWRAWGPAAGVAAAAVYALYPEVLVAERTTFVEPVLNLACLAMANVWAGGRREVSNRAALAAGALAGAALALKLWALAWVVGALLALPVARRRAVLVRFAGAAAGALGVFVAPFALASIGAFGEDVFLFHMWRPPDGLADRLSRTREILGFPADRWQLLGGRHAPGSLAALAGLAVAVVRVRAGARRDELFVATAYGLTVVSLLISRTYWPHYNSHLAASEAALAGLAASAAWHWLRQSLTARSGARAAGTVAGAVVLALFVVGLPVSARRALGDARGRSPGLVATGAEVRRLGSDACVFSFEPVDLLAGGRLPSRDPRLPVIADPYGAMLFAALATGARFDSMGAAFAQESSQAELRTLIDGCRFLVMGSRAASHLSDRTKAWLDANFDRRPGAPDADAIWERRERFVGAR